MAHVVCKPCIKCKYTECVEICPVDVFKEGANMLVIDPELCICCGNCEEYCPVTAILPEEEVPAKWEPYIALNARLAEVWPEIDLQREASADAGKFRDTVDKRDLLDESPGEGS